jgi:hypothetical protein
LNIQHIIDDAIIVDRSGSAILEHILRQDMDEVPGLNLINLKELVMVACWYMWWLRRRRVRDEEVPPLNRCKMSILAITANATVITKKSRVSDVKWEKPKPREVKLNVDASFFQDLHAGVVGAVVRDYKGEFIAASSYYLGERWASVAGSGAKNRLLFAPFDGDPTSRISRIRKFTL